MVSSSDQDWYFCICMITNKVNHNLAFSFPQNLYIVSAISIYVTDLMLNLCINKLRIFNWLQIDFFFRLSHFWNCKITVFYYNIKFWAKLWLQKSRHNSLYRIQCYICIVNFPCQNTLRIVDCGYILI